MYHHSILCSYFDFILFLFSCCWREDFSLSRESQMRYQLLKRHTGVEVATKEESKNFKTIWVYFLSCFLKPLAFKIINNGYSYLFDSLNISNLSHVTYVALPCFHLAYVLCWHWGINIDLLVPSCLNLVLIVFSHAMSLS